MKKNWFNEHWDSIEVPEEDLNRVISNGMKAGKKETRKKSRWKTPALVSSAVATTILVSGLVFSPVTNVLAKVPLLNIVYNEISSPIGRELFHNQFITELNEKASSNDVDVTITSAYYDNMLLGITFEVTSNELSIEDMNDKNSPEFGYSYYLFDGDEQNQWAGSMSELKETDEGFVGAMEFYQPDQSIEKDFTLPITFTSILGKEGEWKFDIPIKESIEEKIKIKEDATITNGEFSFHLNSVTKGKATTILDYTTTRPTDGENDHFEIDVVDDQGNELSKQNIGNRLSTKQTNDSIEVTERSLFGSKLAEDNDYIVIHPRVSRDEFDTIKSIQDTPFEIKSKRFGYKIVVNNVQLNNHQLILDYDLENIDPENFKKDIILNFADKITLIRSEDVIKESDGQAQYEALQRDSLIYGNNGKIIDPSSLHLRSTIDLKDTPNFDTNDYSLMVPFGIFGMNDPIELEPIKIDISSKK